MPIASSNTWPVDRSRDRREVLRKTVWRRRWESGCTSSKDTFREREVDIDDQSGAEKAEGPCRFRSGIVAAPYDPPEQLRCHLRNYVAGLGAPWVCFCCASPWYLYGCPNISGSTPIRLSRESIRASTLGIPSNQTRDFVLHEPPMNPFIVGKCHKFVFQGLACFVFIRSTRWTKRRGGSADLVRQESKSGW